MIVITVSVAKPRKNRKSCVALVQALSCRVDTQRIGFTETQYCGCFPMSHSGPNETVSTLSNFERLVSELVVSNLRCLSHIKRDVWLDDRCSAHVIKASLWTATCSLCRRSYFKLAVAASCTAFSHPPTTRVGMEMMIALSAIWAYGREDPAIGAPSLEYLVCSLRYSDQRSTQYGKQRDTFVHSFERKSVATPFPVGFQEQLRW